MAAAPSEKVKVIIRKKKGGHGGGHHGGAWKVAYADFVTAMMAFFLVMWLLTQADLKLRSQIAQYFRQPGIMPGGAIINGEVSPFKSREPQVVAKDITIVQFETKDKQIVNGTASAEELDTLLDAELDTHHEEMNIPVALLQKTADSLPGLGIVAAVLGIVVTMGHLDGGPEEIGHHVAAALVGTFLGILLCYGLIGPMATSVEMQEVANGKYFRCIKEGIVASLRGAAPSVAVEFARKAIFSDERPSSEEVEEACRALKQAG